MSGTLVVGFVFVDIKGFPVGHYNPRGRNLGKVSFIHGGVARNVAETIAGGGMPVTFASLTEDTAIGNDVVKRLSERGVNVSCMEKVTSEGIGQWMVILNENGDVAGEISCPPSVAALEELIDKKGDGMIRECDNVVIEIDTSAVLSEKVIGLAKRYGKPVYTVVGNMSVILSRRDLVAELDCFVCNESEAGRLFDRDLASHSPDEMLAVLLEEFSNLGCASAVITMGDKGAVYVDGRTGDSGVCPPIPTKLVDSTGAGDAFLSGTVMGLTRGMPLRDAVKVGTLLAHRTIQTTESTAEPDHSLFEKI